jgi:hypothetical protein
MSWSSSSYVAPPLYRSTSRLGSWLKFLLQFGCLAPVQVGGGPSRSCGSMSSCGPCWRLGRRPAAVALAAGARVPKSRRTPPRALILVLQNLLSPSRCGHHRPCWAQNPVERVVQVQVVLEVWAWARGAMEVGTKRTWGAAWWRTPSRCHGGLDGKNVAAGVESSACLQSADARAWAPTRRGSASAAPSPPPRHPVFGLPRRAATREVGRNQAQLLAVAFLCRTHRQRRAWGGAEDGEDVAIRQ